MLYYSTFFLHNFIQLLIYRSQYEIMYHILGTNFSFRLNIFWRQYDLNYIWLKFRIDHFCISLKIYWSILIAFAIFSIRLTFDLINDDSLTSSFSWVRSALLKFLCLNGFILDQKYVICICFGHHSSKKKVSHTIA